MLHWWGREVAGTVDQVAVIETRRAECALSARYLLMTCMSAGIAILGLIQGSAAVVIGAMLLSPLMDPIMGVGFALAIGDYKWLRQSARSLAVGTLVAILFTALVVWASPLQTITSEIASRTRPSLLDLGVAIFSSVAGAYAMIRGRLGTIVGVAIATALMPPLAVVGFGLATLNATVFWGALFLFVTNLTAIALTATAMARLYGFSASLSDKQTRMQTVLIIAAFIALSVPLFLSLRQIVWEAQATRQATATVEEVFGGRATISQLAPSFDAEPMQVSATVFTPQIVGEAEQQAERLLTERLGREVDVTLTQVRVGSSAQAQEEAQLAAARSAEAEAAAQAADIAERLSLLAGVPVDAVTVDRARRRAMVRARPLDGASLAAYFELERRIDATEPEWDIRLTPPLRPLPSVTFERGEGGDAALQPTTQGQQALELIGWAQQRTGVPVRLSGPAETVAAAGSVLAGQGAEVLAAAEGGSGPVSASWTTGE
ncbi:membrane protein [Aurantiacibacter luteus]|uniref:Membrane protein n=1 Tax=Aurantiacibacter luteus TaxID=1581420 RepID=A0A0G9MWG3_9SPHN|nr:membrane protein [Aurantiacibacter luteus]